MQFLNATAQQLPAIHNAIAYAQLRDVQVSPPFLGRVIIQCPNEATAAVLHAVLDGLNPRHALA